MWFHVVSPYSEHVVFSLWFEVGDVREPWDGHLFDGDFAGVGVYPVVLAYIYIVFFGPSLRVVFGAESSFCVGCAVWVAVLDPPGLSFCGLVRLD